MAEIRDIAELDRKITIKGRTVTIDTSSGQRVTNENGIYKQTRAKLIPGGGSEGYEVDGKTATDIQQWVIRYDAGITSEMILEYNSEQYEITAPPSEIQMKGRFYRRRWMLISTKKRTRGIREY